MYRYIPRFKYEINMIITIDTKKDFRLKKDELINNIHLSC